MVEIKPQGLIFIARITCSDPRLNRHLEFLAFRVFLFNHPNPVMKEPLTLGF